MLSRRALLAGGVAKFGRAAFSRPSPKLGGQRRGGRDDPAGSSGATSR